MSDKFYTKVKASEKFWDNVIMKHLERDTPISIENHESNELIIATTGKTALDEIIKLSAEYPEEIFRVKIENNDACNNYVYLYECYKGESKLIKEGYEYYFKINISGHGRINQFELDKFKHDVVHFFKRNENYLPKEVHMDLNDNDWGGRENWSMTLTYKTKDFSFTATKVGLTCIKIDVKFLDYDELPF